MCPVAGQLHLTRLIALDGCISAFEGAHMGAPKRVTRPTSVNYSICRQELAALTTYFRARQAISLLAMRRDTFI